MDDQPKHTEWALPKTTAWLADQGVKFTNGHVTTPLCSPSRSSVLTGRYAHHHGVRNNKASYQLDQSTTLPRYLKQADYRTGLFGKWLNSWTLSDNPPHFEDFALLQPGYVDAQWNVNGTVQTINGYTTNIIKNRTLSFLDKAAADSRPWFAYVTPYASHGPRTPRRSTPARPSRTGTADPPSRRTTAATNRPTSGTRPGPWPTGSRSERNSCAPCSPSTTRSRRSRTSSRRSDSSTTPWSSTSPTTASPGPTTDGPRSRSPTARRTRCRATSPGRMGGLSSGTTDSRITANIDIAPTVLDAAGITPTHSVDGRSLLSSYSRDHLLVEWWQQGTNAGGPPTWASYVGQNKQYTEYYDLTTDGNGTVSGTGQVKFREYYDLAGDPYQLTNKLYQATPAEEQNLGIPALAAQLAADRAA